jgi:hypothetical protein
MRLEEDFEASRIKTNIIKAITRESRSSLGRVRTAVRPGVLAPRPENSRKTHGVGSSC